MKNLVHLLKKDISNQKILVKSLKSLRSLLLPFFLKKIFLMLIF